LHPGCDYADQRKRGAQEKDDGFLPTTPDIMRALVTRAGFEVYDEDTESISHSAVIVFQKTAWLASAA
jgi:hypothetical protein